MTDASVLVRATNSRKRSPRLGQRQSSPSRISSRRELPRDPVKARRKGRKPPTSIRVSKWPGSKEKPLYAIPLVTSCQNAQSLILWPHEHRYVSGFTDHFGPVISPTVVICGCKL